MLVRESPDELTLGAGEVGTWKSCTLSTTLQKGGEVFLWWMLIGTPSAKRYRKASNEKTGESHMMLAKK